MRHHDRNRKLGRVKRQRSALLRGLARSLVLSGGITTTIAKAKALRPYVERLVTISKKDNPVSRQRILAQLGSSQAERKLRELKTRFAKRSGGYTRIIQLGRVGKRVCEMTRIEF